MTKELWKGNEAVAEAAVRAGVQAYFGYPITPQTELLEYLARRAGEVVGRADIAEHVWDETYDPMSNVIDVYVKRLRRKLDHSSEESLIRTRRGEGYILVNDSP